MYLSKPIECTPTVSLKVRLCVKVVIVSSVVTITTLQGGVDNGEGYAYGGAEGIREISVPSPQSSCAPRTILNKDLKKNPNYDDERPAQTGTWLQTSVSGLDRHFPPIAGWLLGPRGRFRAEEKERKEQNLEIP